MLTCSVEGVLKRWYAVYTKSHCEYLVSRHLERLGVEVFLPDLITQTSTKASRRQPFFPCYLFTHLNLSTVPVGQWQSIHGIRSLVCFGDKPAEVPTEVIHLLRHQLSQREGNGASDGPGFRKGDKVRVNAGPFRNEIAIFEGPSRPEERVRVLLAVMGRYYRLKVDAEKLEKVAATAETPRPARHRGTRGRGRAIRSDQ